MNKLSDHLDLQRPYFHVAYAEPVSRMLHVLPYPFEVLADAQYMLDALQKSPRFSQLKLFIVSYDFE